MISAINSKDSKEKKDFLKENKTRLKLIQQRNAQIKETAEAAKSAKQVKKAKKTVPKKVVVKQPIVVETPMEPIEKKFEDFGVQISEINFIDESFMKSGTIMLPSPSIVSSIDELRKLKEYAKIEEPVEPKKEIPKFDGHSTHFSSHLSNLKEFLDSGSISNRRKSKELESDFEIDPVITHLKLDEVLGDTEDDDQFSEGQGTARIQKKKLELLSLIEKFNK